MSSDKDLVKGGLLSRAMGMPQFPTGEPSLAQVDEWQRENLLEACYEEILMVNKENKAILDEKDRPIYRKVCLYPDILALISTIGHLEGTSNYTWAQAHASFLDWKNLVWKPILDSHKRDRVAVDLMYIIYHIKHRQVYGDSQGGSRQRFVVQVSGSDKVIRFLSGGEEKKKRGFLGLW